MTGVSKQTVRSLKTHQDYTTVGRGEVMCCAMVDGHHNEVVYCEHGVTRPRFGQRVRHDMTHERVTCVYLKLWSFAKGLRRVQAIN